MIPFPPFYLRGDIMGKSVGTIKITATHGKGNKRTRNLIKAYKKTLTDTARKWMKEAQREADKAYKGMRGIYKAGFKTTPAIQKAIEDGYITPNGEIRFNVKKHRVQDLQRLYFQLHKFNSYETSTAEGAIRNLKETMSNIGLDWEGNNKAIQQSSTFFEIASKVRQIMEAEGNYAEALSYQRIWTSIREEIQMHTLVLNEATDSIEVAQRITEKLNKLLEEIEEVDELTEFLGRK